MLQGQVVRVTGPSAQASEQWLSLGRGCSLRIQAALGGGEMIAGPPALPRRRDIVPGGDKPQGEAAERRGWGKGGRRSMPTARDHDQMSGPMAAPSEDGAVQRLPPSVIASAFGDAVSGPWAVPSRARKRLRGPPVSKC